MKDIIQDSIRKFDVIHRNTRRYVAILLVLAILTSLTVNWKLHKTGISMTGETYCGYEEEHEHSDECYVTAYTCRTSNGAEDETDRWAVLDEDDSTIAHLYNKLGEAVGTGKVVKDDSVIELADIDGMDDTNTALDLLGEEEAASSETVSASSESAASSVEEEAASSEVAASSTEEKEASSSSVSEKAESTASSESAASSTEEKASTSESKSASSEADASASSSSTASSEKAESAASSASSSASSTSSSSASSSASGLEDTITIENVSLADHEHSTKCTIKVLVCDKTEHTHTVACLSDTTADVETAADWEATLPALTGEWPTDLAGIAASQVDYTESEKNYDTSDGVKGGGYTRYGAWYGEGYEYADWDYFFVSFALHYAGVSDTVLPTHFSGAQMLSSQLSKLDSGAYYHENDGTAPAEGDIVLYTNADGDTTIGIVTYADSESGTYTVISGDVSGAVAEVEITAADITAVLDVNTAYAEYVDDKADTDDTVPVSDPDAVYGTTHTSGKRVSTTSTPRKVNRVSANTPSTVADAEITGIDMSTYVTSVSFQKKNGPVWETSTSFTTSDQVRGNISFENVAVSTLQSNSNTIYIDLPAGIDCSKFTGEYDTYDGDTHSGKYTYQQKSDGSYRIVLVLDDDYVNNAGDVIGGQLKFEFYWDGEEINDQGKIPWNIGGETGEVDVKKDTSDKKEDANAKYSIEKKDGGISYDSDGYVYIRYDVKLQVKEAMTAPINMKDVIEGNDFTYVTDETGDRAISVTGGDVKVNFGSTQGSGVNTTIQLWPNSGNTVPKGTYTITYYVKSNKKLTEETEVPSSVHNKIQVPDSGDNTISSETWTKTTTGTINKQGEVTKGDGNTYIDYTVYLNAGAIVKNLKTAANFTDTLPDTLELVGDVTVKQYDVTGTLKNTTTATVNGQYISYTTPTGQYYYVITYRTKVKNTVTIPVGGLTIENTGKSDGGIKGESTDKETIKNDNLKKKFVDQTLAKNDTDNKWYDTIRWKSTINVSGSLDGYTYEDYGGTMQDPQSTEGYWFAPISMSDAQRDNIVVKDSSGNVITSGYTVTTSDHVDSSRYSSDGVNVKNGLFKITFDSTVSGPVTLEYETTVDMSRLTLNSYYTFINYAELTKDGSTAYAQDQTKTLQYVQDMKKIIHKYGGSYYSDSNSQKIELDPGQTWIPWTIGVNEGQSLYSDITVTDTIPEGLTFDASTFVVRLNALNGQDVTSSVTWSYDTSTRTLKVEIPKSLYCEETEGNKHSQAIVISFRTNLPDDFIKGSDESKDFSNTAHATIDGNVTDSTFTQKVTREVVGKSGSYDAVEKTLSYQIVVNPDGATLNNGSAYTVKDVLKLKNSSSQTGSNAQVLETMELTKVEVFTAVVSENSAGKTVVEPGAFVTELTKTDSEDPSVGTYFAEHYRNKDKVLESLNFTTKLADSTAYVLVATYSVDLDATEDITLSNKVELKGTKDWNAEDKDTQIKKSTAGETHTNKDTITLTKRDKSAYNTIIPGATFKLEQYDSSTSGWKDFTYTKSDSTTSTDKATQTSADGTGKITWEGITYNTLYKLTETAAPAGYVTDSTPTYLIVVREGAEYTLPDTISGDSDYSKNAVKVFTVKNDDTEKGKIYYANVEIDRYNSKDTTKVEPGQLRVTKVWVDSKGSTVTDATELAKLSEVSVTLTKHVPNAGHTVTIKATDSDWAQTKTFTNVNDGAYIIAYTGQYQSQPKVNEFKCSDSSVQITDEGVKEDGNHYYKVGPINTDCTIIEGTLAYIDYNGTVNGYTQGGTPASGTTDTVIGTVTLNSANDWSYLWSNLDRSSGVTYTITETTVDGYTVTYTLNGSDLEPGTTFTPSESGDKVTITNTAYPEYDLPETGGMGTLPFTIAGGGIMAAGLLSGLLRRRRRGAGGEH